MTRALQPCGTPAAALRHYRRGEPIDDKCRLAFNAYRNENKLTPGDVRDRMLTRKAARSRALTRLCREHPERFAELLAEELAAAS